MLTVYEGKQGTQTTRSFQQFTCILKLKNTYALLVVS